jgi:hypothetical protein
MTNLHEENQPADNAATFSVSELTPQPKRGTWKVMLPVSLVIVGVVWLALALGWNVKLVAAGVVLLGLISNAFVWILGLITLLPVAGPLIVKVLALPIIWLLNAMGYLVSYVAIHRGYSKDVLTYRSLTIALLVGIVIGFVIGSLI